MLDTTTINALWDLSQPLATSHLISHYLANHHLANHLSNASMVLDLGNFDFSNYVDSWQTNWQTHWHYGWQHTSELMAQLTKEGQQFQGDVLGDMGKGWRKFVESGQIWAMIIGAIMGYLFRSITSM